MRTARMGIWPLLLGLLLHTTPSHSVKVSHPYQVEISSGQIRGEYLEIGHEPFTVFKGIPYARPPVGQYRFRRVEKPAPWRGVMNATQYEDECFQFTGSNKASRYHRIRTYTDQFGMSEDCLYLNVFSPPPFNNESYAVIVFFHPGGFQIGSANDFKQEPILTNFVSRGVVVVTLNYRLGPLGFLTTRDSVLPGNNGLHDILLALKWVQQDIKSFGGDKDRVTLMGHGSGAVAASILSISPKAFNLFSQTVLMSGTAVMPGAIRDTAYDATWALNTKLGCRSANSTALHTCLMRVTAMDLVNNQFAVRDDYQEFVPMIDGREDLLPDDPRVLASRCRKKPLLLGTTKDESVLSLLILARQGVNMSALNETGATNLVHNLTASYAGFRQHNLIEQGCLYEYVHTRDNPQAEPGVLKDGILEMYSHFWYNAPATRLATYYDASDADVFLYSFDHESENLFIDEDEWLGAFHGSDMILLFETDFDFLRERKDRNWQLDRRVTEIFAGLLTNFVKEGHPTPVDSGFAFNWTNYKKTQLNYLSITDSPQMKTGFHWRGHIFWNYYVDHLERTDVGSVELIGQLQDSLADFQMATLTLSITAFSFLAILVGLAFYCTRKDSEEDDI